MTLLVPPLDAALAAAQAALTAGDSVRWELPAGEHDVPAGILGLVDADVEIVGLGAVLNLVGGGLVVRGGTVVVRDLELRGDAPAALGVEATTASLARVRVSGAGAGDGAALSVEATSASLVDVDVSTVGDGHRTAVFVDAESVRLAGLGAQVDASGDAIGIEASGDATVHADDLAVHVTGGAAAIGLRLAAPELDLVAGRATGDAGAAAVGIALAGAVVRALDLTVSGLGAGDDAMGVQAVGTDSCSLRGLTVRALRGDQLVGICAVGGGSVEVASGTVQDLLAATGRAHAVRVFGFGDAEDVDVRDLAIDRVGGVGAADRPPVSNTWRDWAVDALASAALGVSPGAWPADVEAWVAGVVVDAELDDVALVGMAGLPGEVRAQDLLITRVGGDALVLSGGLRGAAVGPLLTASNARIGQVASETLRVDRWSSDQHLRGLDIGPGEIEILDAVITRVAEGLPLIQAEDTDLVPSSVWSDVHVPGVEDLAELPWVEPAPGPLDPAVLTGAVPDVDPPDLRLADPGAFDVTDVPGESLSWVGAWPPDTVAGCSLDDPLAPDFDEAPVTPGADPLVDYRARDARGFLQLMLDRARVTMPDWVERGPADQTRMIFELLADRLDHLSWAQERAVEEGSLETARLRRSVEDHARPLDVVPDAGLSATVVLRVGIDRDEVEKLATHSDPASRRAEALHARLLGREDVTIPAGTLVGTSAADAEVALFTTEADLAWRGTLEALPLRDALAKGAIEMVLDGAVDDLEEGRWLLLAHPDGPAHVVRVTGVDPSGDRTWVGWDPRRPLPWDLPESGLVNGNIVVAHHGVSLQPTVAGAAEDPLLGPWQERLRTKVHGSEVREVEVPLAPVSVHRSGFPLPDDAGVGTPTLEVAVEGDVWSRVDDLSAAGPAQEVYVVRGEEDGLVVRFGDGVNGAALPGREVELTFSLSLGHGISGNVGPGTLTRLLRLGAPDDGEASFEELVSSDPGAERDHLVRQVLRFDNPIAAVGGRPREDVERLRYRAPLSLRDPLSAVAIGDYELLLQRLPEVAAARARSADVGLRTVITVVALLRDLDSLPRAEVLRRWAMVREELERIRLLGFDVELAPPRWIPLDIDLVVEPGAGLESGQVRNAVRQRLVGPGGLFDPDTTGLGHDVHLSRVYQAVLSVPGVAAVRARRFRQAVRGAEDHLEAGVIPIPRDAVATAGGPVMPPELQPALTIDVCTPGGLR